MSVNGILEGYLTIYGWQVYGSIFMLLVAVGAVLYPVARIVFEAAIAYTESGGSPELRSRALILRLTICFLVLVLGLIPIAPIKITSTTVQNHCGREALALLGQKYEAMQGKEYGFAEVQDARVPLLPYLAMVLASGFNAVIYQAIPCVHDLTHLNLVMNTLDFSAATDPNALKSSVARFETECGLRAQRIAVDFLTGTYGPEGQKFMEDLLEKYGKTEVERREQMVYFGSQFYRQNFYQKCVGNGNPNTPLGKLCDMITPLRSQKSVDGFPYDPNRDSDASAYQAATGQGFPTCDEWWNDPAHGLRAQLVKAGGDALQKKVFALTVNTCPEVRFAPFAICRNVAAVAKDIENAEDTVVKQMLLASKRQLSDKTPELSWSSALVAGGLFAFTDVAENIAKQSAGYLVTIYLMKIGSSLLQPFVLMGVFMLWGLFLVIGELRGMTLIKGMMLIFALSILPSLWQFADYIDDLLFLTLYPNAPSFSITHIPAELMSDHSTIERILLAFTTAVFYLILPMIMLYLIAEAGGPSRVGSAVTGSMHNLANEQGGIVGGSVRSAGIRSWRKGSK
ncbi:membrane hypothetical protein [Candidatus Competibacter denitrificans Run_A_D11]|uniref:TraG N-terminal Proteobacteria domain-containing protein n=1 Tax=Candidatus Competibacter denitrificans Run_A_D11 TaxID=1400863 RepID=W6MCE9_9GAMM|nr:conjugal transfer protein TraG N-terminal domain-containing protein [Candidatus Competibacter denitrificans]CDI04779.1 membrane hypothetical protein [Candidatus Competibacter denitrificans Run_A_D11]